MNKAANVLLIITCALLFVGFLFKSQHWPGATMGIVLGTMFSWIAMLFYFIARHINKEKVKIATYSVYFYFFVMVSGLSVFASSSASRDLLNSFCDVQFRMETLNGQLYADLNSDPISIQTKEAYDMIEENKKWIITSGESEFVNYEEEIYRFVDDRGIPLNKDNQDIAATYFLVIDNGGAGRNLENSLKELRKVHASVLGENHPLLMERIEEKPDHYDPSVIINYSYSICEHLPVATVLAKLTLIQNQILNTNAVVQEKLANDI